MKLFRMFRTAPGVRIAPPSRQRRRGSAGWGVLLGCSLFLLPSCSNENASGKSGPPTPLGVPVTVATVVQKTVPVQVRAIGNVQAYATVAVKSQVDGQVERVEFREGQDVRKGQVLFVLDQRSLEAALHQAEGNAARNVAQLQQAEAALAQSQAAEQQAEANLARDMAQVENTRAQERRYKGLINDGAISMELYDQVRTSALAMEATVQADRAAVANARAAIRAAQATVANARAAIQADQAMVENARIQLGYTTIRAPMDGRTGNLLVRAGSTVKARDDNSQMVVINQVHPIYLVFAVPEQNLPDIKKYRAAGSLTVEAFLADQVGAPVRGELTFMNNTVDPQTGMIQLKATFPNAENRLWPGQFVTIALTLATQPNALLVPSQAVQASQQGQQVFVVKPDMTVEARPVVLGAPVGNDIVVEKGVAAGERVVTEGQLRLVPGTKVEIKAAPPAPAARERAG